ncbi:MAG: tyrosine-type recombinase/integrase, partial [Boseongicola sp. SB0675_bin_26]|nr:tyrosine-type recombinase/integrase [Boseongicola sp. SB0675_bin_26]
MTDLDVLLDEYLATRRALGARLVLPGRLLKRFVAFATGHGDTVITRTRALEWATAPREAHPAQWANRLGMVCRFSRYAGAVDPRHEIVPQGLLPYRYVRREPYIYSDREIADLIGAARRLPGATGLRSLTFATLLGLLAVTGMRTNEILNLDRDDVDLAQGVLTIRNGKFGKSRHVVVHASTGRALERYAEQRDRLCATPRCPAFFVSEHGSRIT